MVRKSVPDSSRWVAKQGAHMRRPAQSPHRIVSSKTGRVRLHAGPGPVPSAVLCEARPLVAKKKAAPLVAQ